MSGLATVPIEPLAVVPVRPTGYPFRDSVFRHVAGELEWRMDIRLLAETMTSALRRGGAPSFPG